MSVPGLPLEMLGGWNLEAYKAQTGQDLGDRDRCHREADVAGGMRIENGLEATPVFGVVLEEIDDRRGIDSNPRVRR